MESIRTNNKYSKRSSLFCTIVVLLVNNHMDQTNMDSYYHGATAVKLLHIGQQHWTISLQS